MALNIHSYASLINLMDSSGLVLTDAQALEIHRLCMSHLQSWIWLHVHGMSCDRYTPGRRCWQLMPKLHHMWHLSRDTLSWKLNPRTSQLLAAESFIGTLGRIARVTHRKTVSARTLERYQEKMHLKLKLLADGL